MKFTPSWRRRQRLGVSSGVIESGRKPSSTRTMFSVALPAVPGAVAVNTAAKLAAVIKAARARVDGARCIGFLLWLIAFLVALLTPRRRRLLATPAIGGDA